MALTPKQARFVEEYLLDLNATQAAIRAGYSRHTAAEMGFENLRKPQIQDALQARRHALADQYQVTPERVIRELALVGFADMHDYAAWGPNGVELRTSVTLTPEQTRVVGEVSQTTTQHGGTIRFKLHPKVDALEKLGRHLGLFQDKLDLTSKGKAIELVHRYGQSAEAADADAGA